MTTTTCQYKFLELSKTCPHPPLEGDPTNYCLFHSRIDKKNIVTFQNGIEDKLEKENFDFEGYYFPPGLEVDFGGKKFKDAKFRSALFKGDVNFDMAKFSGKTNFNGAKFLGRSTSFYEAEFSGERNEFIQAEFSGEYTDFIEAKLSGRSTDFGEAKFSGKSTYFNKAKFSGESTYFDQADFSGCGTVYFVDTVFKGECEFLEVEFPLRSDQFVIFAGTRDPIDLSNTVFLYSNYDRLTFRNCKFHEGPEELFGRRFPDLQGWKRLLTWRRKVILKDESFIGEELKEITKEEEKKENLKEGSVWKMSRRDLQKEGKVRWSHVESLYRQFKKNLEAEKDWELAGEFHYGEMECKRKGITSQWPALKWIRQNLGLLAWYKYFSGYGERPLRTSCWIVSLLLVFAGIYCWLDLQPRQGCGYYLWELSVKATFLQRIGETGNEPIRAYGKFFYLLQSVLCPTLIALFILALRRRVRR